MRMNTKDKNKIKTKGYFLWDKNTRYEVWHVTLATVWQTLMSFQGFRAQRFYLNLLPVFVFLHHPTDLYEPDNPVTSVFLILQHRKSYKPSKNGAICALACLLCAQRFCHSPVFDTTFVQTLIHSYSVHCFSARRFILTLSVIWVLSTALFLRELP